MQGLCEVMEIEEIVNRIPITGHKVWDTIEVGDSISCYEKRCSQYTGDIYYQRVGTFIVSTIESYGRGPGLPRDIFELTDDRGCTLRLADYPRMYLVKRGKNAES